MFKMDYKKKNVVMSFDCMRLGLERFKDISEAYEQIRLTVGDEEVGM